MGGKAAGIQKHVVRSSISVIRVGEHEVRVNKNVHHNVGENLWLGRGSFAELG